VKPDWESEGEEEETKKGIEPAYDTFDKHTRVRSMFNVEEEGNLEVNNLIKKKRTHLPEIKVKYESSNALPYSHMPSQIISEDFRIIDAQQVDSPSYISEESPPHRLSPKRLNKELNRAQTLKRGIQEEEDRKSNGSSPTAFEMSSGGSIIKKMNKSGTANSQSFMKLLTVKQSDKSGIVLQDEGETPGFKKKPRAPSDSSSIVSKSEGSSGCNHQKTASFNRMGTAEQRAEEIDRIIDLQPQIIIVPPPDGHQLEADLVADGLTPIHSSVFNRQSTDLRMDN